MFPKNHSQYKHGLCDHKLYVVWENMKSRCYYKNAASYKYYGNRGIRVCIRWRRSFISFYSFCISNGWKEGLQIDRIDNDGNYTPSNCRFVTSRQNSLNKGMQSNNTSGFIGVNFRRDRDKYRACIKINGCFKHLGYFYTAKYAAKARDNYIKENNLIYN